MCTASNSKRSSAATSASRATSSFMRVTWLAAPGNRNSCSTRRPSTIQCGAEHEARLHGIEHREVELVLERRQERRDVLLGATGRVEPAVQEVQHVRPRARRARAARARARRTTRQRVGDALTRVVRPEERVPRIDERRAPVPSFELRVTERHAAAVVHERGVLDEVAQPEARRAQAEVDLLAVAAAERLLVEQAAEIERAPGHVHAEADAGDHLGQQTAASARARTPRTRRSAGRRSRARTPRGSRRGSVQIDP